MNAATKIICEIAVAEWSDMGFEDDYRAEAKGLENYFLDLMEDFCDDYDQNWFALIATPAIRNTIDWEAVAAAVNKMLLEREE